LLLLFLIACAVLFLTTFLSMLLCFCSAGSPCNVENRNGVVFLNGREVYRR
jgi:hypothetical protein